MCKNLGNHPFMTKHYEKWSNASILRVYYSFISKGAALKSIIRFLKSILIQIKIVKKINIRKNFKLKPVHSVKSSILCLYLLIKNL